MPRTHCVYIMSSAARVLYTGVTGNLDKRVWEHRQGTSVFTARWGIRHLVYAESCPDAATAIRREKQIKKWHRCQKLALIERANPGWFDLAADWYGERGARVPIGGDGGRYRRRKPGAAGYSAGQSGVPNRGEDAAFRNDGSGE